MNKRVLIALICFFQAEIIFCQGSFSYFENNSTLPSGITESSSSKARKEIKTENKNQRREIRKATRAFYYDANFALDNFLYNGKVIFNNKFNSYINKLADVLLKNNPLVRSRLKFYLVSSAEVNAYTNHEGSVFITTGLLARLKNEAELASVLSHEAVHYVMKHSLVSHIEEFKMDIGISTYRNDVGNEILRKHSFSREQETQADLYGFLTLHRSGYKIKSALDVFETLRTADQPYFAGQFKEDFFTLGNKKFPKEWFTDEYIDPLSFVEKDDSKSTHPATSKRIDTLRKVISSMKLDTTKGSDFLVSASDFQDLKKQAVFYLCNLYTLEEDYMSSFYHLACLRKDDPDNEYLNAEFARLFYVYADYRKNLSGSRNGKTRGSVITINRATTEEEFEKKGVLKQTDVFFNSYKPVEISLMALYVNHQAYLKSAKKENKSYLAECLRILVMEQEFELEKCGFKKDGNKVLSDTSGAVDTVQIRKQFIGFLGNEIKSMFTNELISELYNNAITRKNGNKKSVNGLQIQQDPDLSDLKQGRKVFDTTFKGVGENLIVLDPEFFVVDLRNDQEIYEQAGSEEKEIMMIDKLRRSGESFKNKKVSLYDWKSLKQEDVKQYDQLAALNEWYYEFHKTGGRPLWTNEWKKEKLMRETGGRYVAEFMFISVKMSKSAFFYIVQLYKPIIMPLWFPDAVLKTFQPKIDTYMMFKLYDLEKNKLVFTDVKSMNKVRPHPSIIGGLMHNEILKTFNGKLFKK